MPITKDLATSINKFLDVSNTPHSESIYLETGLDEGNSIQDIQAHFNFKKFISIDIDQQKIDKAKQRFKNEIANSKVLLVQGDSGVKIKEIYNQSINIIFLDAHGLHNSAPGDKLSHDPSVSAKFFSADDLKKIFPLENEINFLIDKINDKQLIIIDDYIKIRNDYLFNDIYDWRSYFKHSDFKKYISRKRLYISEIFREYGMNSYLLLTKNKNFKIEKKLFLKNIIFRFLSIRFYFLHGRYLVYPYIKKFIILTSEKFFNKLKKTLRKS